jgi:phospholipid-binding lipoprotein MlaA
MPNHTEDFGQTLGVWGVGGDPYPMLPVLGPSSPRDLSGQAVDVGLDPMTGLRFKQQICGRRVANISRSSTPARSSVDFYAPTRSLYRRHRENEIRNGQTDKENLPDL